MTNETETQEHDVQLYSSGVPFVPTDRTPLTDDEVRARAVSVTAGGDAVMFDHGGKLE